MLARPARSDLTSEPVNCRPASRVSSIANSCRALRFWATSLKGAMRERVGPFRLVNQPRVDHRRTHHLLGLARYRHHRQAQLVADVAEQRERVLGGLRAGLGEERGVQRQSGGR